MNTLEHNGQNMTGEGSRSMVDPQYTTTHGMCDIPLPPQGINGACESLMSSQSTLQVWNHSDIDSLVQNDKIMQGAVPLAPSLNSDDASSTFTNMKKMSQDSKDLWENETERVAENLDFIQNSFKQEQHHWVSYAGAWASDDPTKRLEHILECDTVEERNDWGPGSCLGHVDSEADNIQIDWEYLSSEI
jgi:hypothetical protein